jgi:hypothetical protein
MRGRSYRVGVWFGYLVLNVGVVCGRPRFATKMRVGLGGLLQRAGLGNGIEDGGSIGALSLRTVDQNEDGCRSALEFLDARCRMSD